MLKPSNLSRGRRSGCCKKNRAAAQGRICVQCLFPTVEEWSALADCHCSLQGSCCKASSVHFVLCRGKKLRCCPPLLQPGQLRKKSSRGFAKSLVDLIFIHFPARHIGRTEGNNGWRTEIRKLSLVLMLSDSPDSWQATNIGGYGNVEDSLLLVLPH
jgi:hypothetical protein